MGIVNVFFFEISFYFVRRGREGLRELQNAALTQFNNINATYLLFSKLPNRSVYTSDHISQCIGWAL